jgi:CrcB protein
VDAVPGSLVRRAGRTPEDPTGENGPVELPIDPDLDPGSATALALPFGHVRPSRWPRLRLDVIAVIFLGGCLGGWARYAAVSTWPPSSGRFPWATFSVNTAGAFLIAIVVVAAADLVSSRYLRPVLGTGFCGAFTTFSSVVVATDQLLAHHHAGTAAAYLGASIVAGLAAASFGLICARAVVTSRRRTTEKGIPS